MPDNLRTARETAKLSQEKLGKLAGTSRQQISRLEKDDRQFTKKWAERLAPHLGVRAQELMFSNEFELANKSFGSTRVPILGEVAAGLWLEVGAIPERPEKWIPFSPDERLPKDATFGLIVRGDSINKTAKEGSVLVCVDLYKGGIEIKGGDLVIVERIRPDASREFTAKRVHAHDGGAYSLEPESTNPRWKPLRFDPKSPDDADITVRVLAKVVYIVTQP